MSDQVMGRDELSARLDAFGHKEIRLDRYANKDSNSMPFLRQLESERNAAKEVILAHDAALREELAQLKEWRDVREDVLAQVKKERDSWHEEAGSHLMALCEKQGEVNGLEQELAAVTRERDGLQTWINTKLAPRIAALELAQARIAELEEQP